MSFINYVCRSIYSSWPKWCGFCCASNCPDPIRTSPDSIGESFNSSRLFGCFILIVSNIHLDINRFSTPICQFCIWALRKAARALVVLIPLLGINHLFMMVPPQDTRWFRIIFMFVRATMITFQVSQVNNNAASAVATNQAISDKLNHLLTRCHFYHHHHCRFRSRPHQLGFHRGEFVLFLELRSAKHSHKALATLEGETSDEVSLWGWLPGALCATKRDDINDQRDASGKSQINSPQDEY